MLSYKQNVYACIHMYEYEFFTCKMCRLSVIYISYTVGSSYDKVLGGGRRVVGCGYGMAGLLWVVGKCLRIGVATEKRYMLM